MSIFVNVIECHCFDLNASLGAHHKNGQNVLLGKFNRGGNGILMGTICFPLPANFNLYESEISDNMLIDGYRILTSSFNLCYRYTNDLIVFSSKKSGGYVTGIYPPQLTVEKVRKSGYLANYFGLVFIIDSHSRSSTKLYNKHDDFNFHTVNFPFFSSNRSSGPSYEHLAADKIYKGVLTLQ